MPTDEQPPVGAEGIGAHPDHLAAQGLLGLEAELDAAEALEERVEQLLQAALERVRLHQQGAGESAPPAAQHLRQAAHAFLLAVDKLYAAEPLDHYILRLRRIIRSLETALTGETPLARSVHLAEQLLRELSDLPKQQQQIGWEDL